MSINHLINPDIDPKLDLYTKSITLSSGRKITSFKQYFTRKVEVTSPQYFGNIIQRKTVVEVIPITDGLTSKNQITMKISGVVDVVNLPLFTNSELKVDWTEFATLEAEENIQANGVPKYGDCSIQTRQGTLMDGTNYTQHIPLNELQPNSVYETTFKFSPVTTGADSGDYSSFPNCPFEITLEFVSEF